MQVDHWIGGTSQHRRAGRAGIEFGAVEFNSSVSRPSQLVAKLTHASPRSKNTWLREVEVPGSMQASSPAESPCFECSYVWLSHVGMVVSFPHSARLTAPLEINAVKKLIIRSAIIPDRTKTPTSMFRSCAASVKLADETNAIRPSMTTHLAWRTAFRFASIVSDRGSK